MEKKEFLDISREYFKSIGFQTLKKSKFYYEADDYFLVVVMTLSNFSETYYLDYWISIKALHNKETNSIKNLIVDAQGRFGDNKIQVEIEYEKEEKETYLKCLEQQSKIHIEPILRLRLTAIVKSPYIFVYKQEVKNFLKCIK